MDVHAGVYASVQGIQYFFTVCVCISFDPVSVNRHCNKDLPLEGMDSAPGFTGLTSVTKREPAFNDYNQINKTGRIE